MTNTIEERLEQNSENVDLSIIEKTGIGLRNYVIDTSVKVVCYAPLMAIMEAYNGLNEEQIIKSRTVAALVDAGVARVYTKTADYLSEKFNVDIKNGGFKAWALDTLAMVGVYTPVYAGILAVAGADSKKIGSALLMGAGIAATTSRPFRRYVLTPLRKIGGYKK